MTKVLTQETVIRLGVRLTTQDYQNVAIEIGREYISAEFIQDLLITEDILYEDYNVVVSTINLTTTYSKDIAE